MNHSISHKKPITPIITKAAPHPQCTLIHGTVNGARIAPTFEPELNIPVARDLSFFGKYSAVAFIAAGKLPASPKASTARENINPRTETEKPAIPAQPRIAETFSPTGMANA